IYHNLASFSEFVVNEGLRYKMVGKSVDDVDSMIKGMEKIELNDFFVEKAYDYLHGEIPLDFAEKYNKKIYDYIDKWVRHVNRTDEKIDYSKFKKVSPSLLYNFLSKVGKLGVNFKLNTTYVKGVPNSFNNKSYVLT
ncbi:MAG: hypothetical protein ACOC2W_04980, partial [bacterium]